MCNTILRSHIQELQQTKPSAITTYANIPRVDRFAHQNYAIENIGQCYKSRAEDHRTF